ncbi:MAG: NAD-dependent epimerase/dehydratase family protein, partial [Loktanella sp.]|nr:NAD-dependent epimerase/dehydratase family protein [Loktanella sp.]
MREDALLTGVLEPTNEPYAIAKIAGIKLCESYNRQHGTDYRSVMPTNLYGPGDNFHPENSHVLPALIRRFHEAAQTGAESVTIWGSGQSRREFLHVDDMADARNRALQPGECLWCRQAGDGTGLRALARRRDRPVPVADWQCGRG